MKFEEWYTIYCTFDGDGVKENCELLWNYKQQKIDELEKDFRKMNVVPMSVHEKLFKNYSKLLHELESKEFNFGKDLATVSMDMCSFQDQVIKLQTKLDKAVECLTDILHSERRVEHYWVEEKIEQCLKDIEKE